MNYMIEEPPRLGQGQETSPALTSALMAARREQPSQKRLAMIAGGLGGLGIPVVANAAPLVFWTSTKVVVLAGALALTGGAGAWTWSQGKGPVDRGDSNQALPQPLRTEVAIPTSELIAPAETPASTAPREELVRPTRVKRDNTKTLSAQPSSDPLPPQFSMVEESALLERARVVLKTRPQEALTVLKTYSQRARLAGGGILGQEAARLRIEALHADHQWAQAVTAADSFLQAYGGSTHVWRVKQLRSEATRAVKPPGH